MIPVDALQNTIRSGTGLVAREQEQLRETSIRKVLLNKSIDDGWPYSGVLEAHSFYDLSLVSLWAKRNKSRFVSLPA